MEKEQEREWDRERETDRETEKFSSYLGIVIFLTKANYVIEFQFRS